MRTRAGLFALVALVAGVATGACGPKVDLTKGLEVQVLSSGWFDAGIVNGQNKIVPTITISLKNISDQTLVTLQVNAMFRRLNEKEEWGSDFRTIAGSEGLAPGVTSPALTIRSNLGYTGSDSRQQLLHNSQFVDVKVDVFAKYGSGQWARIGNYPVSRQLITQ